MYLFWLNSDMNFGRNLCQLQTINYGLMYPLPSVTNQSWTYSTVSQNHYNLHTIRVLIYSLPCKLWIFKLKNKVTCIFLAVGKEWFWCNMSAIFIVCVLCFKLLVYSVSFFLTIYFHKYTLPPFTTLLQGG